MAYQALETAWLAGIFEGEGTIVFHSTRSVRLRVVMTDQDVVERFADTIGRGTLRGPIGSDNARHRSLYCWDVSSAKDVIAVLERLLPWLGERRSTKAREAIERLQTMEQFTRAPGHCRNGHDLSEAGRYNDGHCRVCRRTQNMARYYRRRQA